MIPAHTWNATKKRDFYLGDEPAHVGGRLRDKLPRSPDTIISTADSIDSKQKKQIARNISFS